MGKINEEELKKLLGGSALNDEEMGTIFGGWSVTQNICYAQCAAQANQDFLDGVDRQSLWDDLLLCKSQCDSQ